MIVSLRSRNQFILCTYLCLVSSILEFLGIQKIELFFLDVEGGELDALRGIDFTNVQISNFIIEADGTDPAKENEIALLLDAVGYRLVGTIGEARNKHFQKVAEAMRTK